jgi:hypothetical protein
MSVQVLGWVLENSTAVGVERLVLIALANHADVGGGSCYPSLDRIAHEARASRRHVIRAIQGLEEQGHIVVVRGGGRGHSNHYRLILSEQCPDVPVSERETVTSEPERVTSEPINSDVMSPEPSLAVSEPREAPNGAQPQQTKKRATPPPEDFTPDQGLLDWAAQHCPGVDVLAQTARWLDWCAANGKLFKDHRAAWRTWMSRAVEYDKPVTQRAAAEVGYARPAPIGRCDECGKITIDCHCPGRLKRLNA